MIIMQPEETEEGKIVHFIQYTSGILPVPIISRTHINIRRNIIIFYNHRQQKQGGHIAFMLSHHCTDSIGNTEADISFTSTSCYWNFSENHLLF